MAHPRVLKRANGTRQVQISWGKTAGKRQVEYVGSGRTDEEVELLLVEAKTAVAAAPEPVRNAPAPAGGKAKASKGKGRTPAVKGQPKPYKKRQGR